MWSSASGAPLPQSITLDLDGRRSVEGLVYQPRLDGNANGMIGAYEVAVSDDGESFEPVADGTWPLSTGTKVVTWDERRARYVRLTATGAGGCDGRGFATASELNVVSDRAPEPTADSDEQGPPFDAYVPHEEMTATASSIYGPGYEAARAVDGDCGTFWHTAPGATRPLPATLTLDLGGERTVEGLTYLPRQDGNGNGLVTAYNAYVSTDGETYTKVAGGTFPADALRKWVAWEPVAARYLRFEPTAGTANVASVATMEVAIEAGE
jgi:F5/8 type C domain